MSALRQAHLNRLTNVSEAVSEQLDERETRAAAAHLNYEMKMMAALYAWTRRFEETGPALMKNACLEAT